VSDALARVIQALEPSLRENVVAKPPPGELAPTVGDPERAFVIEAVREGYLLHYGEPRALEGMDEDLRLLAGDALFALGLARLAELGDLDSVEELSDLISLCARAHAEGRPELLPALWRASADRLSGRSGDGARAALNQALEPASPPGR
jgi:hypothetical protein